MYSNSIRPNKADKLPLVLMTAIGFSGFYTVKLGLSPVYIAFIIATLGRLISKQTMRSLWRENVSTTLCLATLIYAFTLKFTLWDFKENLSSTWINLVFSLLYYILAISTLQASSQEQVIRASKFFVIMSFILLTLESIYRLLNPSIPEDWSYLIEDISWYQYKTSSFMYPDSNSVGLFASCLLAFVISLNENYNRYFRIFQIPLLILICLTLSRSAIIASIFILSLHYTRNFRAKSSIRIGFVIIGIISLWSLFADDESFLSKFWIFETVKNYFYNAEKLTLIFGVGPGNAEKVLGVGAHLLIATWLVEIGVAGTCLIIALWTNLFRRTGSKGASLFIVILINGLSFSTFAIPWFYTMIAIIIFFERSQASVSFRPPPSL